MLTANFYAGLAGWLTRTTTQGTNRTGGSANISMEVLAGTSGVKMAMLNPTTYYSNATYGVFFGSGTTPPTVNDYSMESVITSGLTIAKPSAVSVNDTDDYWEMSVTYGISASSDTTISEVGLCVVYNQSTNMDVSFMVDHTVLETPIEIPAGQSKQVTYTIRLNKPK